MGKKEYNNMPHDFMNRLENIIKQVFKNIDTIECFNHMAEYSSELNRHSLNVAILSIMLGICFYEDDISLEELFISALLHDYGKVFIPQQVLEKKGQFTWDERKLVELHPYMGYTFLKRNYSFTDNMLIGIIDHHEKVDGSGYGNQKCLDNISDYGKIIAITDVYDAMVSDRSYRKGVSPDKVIRYIMNNTGIFFDPVMTEAFVYCLNIYREDIENLTQFFQTKAVSFSYSSLIRGKDNVRMINNDITVMKTG